MVRTPPAWYNLPGRLLSVPLPDDFRSSTLPLAPSACRQLTIHSCYSVAYDLHPSFRFRVKVLSSYMLCRDSHSFAKSTTEILPKAGAMPQPQQKPTAEELLSALDLCQLRLWSLLPMQLQASMPRALSPSLSDSLEPPDHGSADSSCKAPCKQVAPCCFLSMAQQRSGLHGGCRPRLKQ